MAILSMLERLSVVTSFNRASVSDDNPYSESLLRTIKYHRSFQMKTRFTDIADGRKWMEKFVRWCNTKHLNSGLKFVTSRQRHACQYRFILENHHRIYQIAKGKRTEPWSDNAQNWLLSHNVTLNPRKNGEIEGHGVIEELMVAA